MFDAPGLPDPAARHVDASAARDRPRRSGTSRAGRPPARGAPRRRRRTSPPFSPPFRRPGDGGAARESPPPGYCWQSHVPSANPLGDRPQCLRGSQPMPTYVYECAKCGDEFEVWQSIKDDPLKRHTGSCRGKLTKVIQPAGIVLKGSGFYKNDSRSGSKRGKLRVVRRHLGRVDERATRAGDRRRAPPTPRRARPDRPTRAARLGQRLVVGRLARATARRRRLIFEEEDGQDRLVVSTGSTPRRLDTAPATATSPAPPRPSRVAAPASRRPSVFHRSPRAARPLGARPPSSPW